jgi:hypothetical protein
MGSATPPPATTTPVPMPVRPDDDLDLPGEPVTLPAPFPLAN